MVTAASLSLAQQRVISPLAAWAPSGIAKALNKFGTITALDKACAANLTATSNQPSSPLGS